MNMIDYGILAILGLSSLIGVYQGFVVSVLNVASFFISWLSALLFYPQLSQALQAKTKIVPTLLYYTEPSSKIANIEYRKMSIDALPTDRINEIIQNANLPSPFDSLLQTNIVKQVFNAAGYNTLADYFNYTIINIIINIISFLIIFFAVRLLLELIIRVANAVVKLPVLKQFDGLLGAAFGIFRGIFLVFIIFSLVPVFLAVTPVDILTPFLEKSLFANFFYKSNIITSIIKGVI